VQTPGHPKSIKRTPDTHYICGWAGFAALTLKKTFTTLSHADFAHPPAFLLYRRKLTSCAWPLP
jgi:hypothetical protein